MSMQHTKSGKITQQACLSQTSSKEMTLLRPKALCLRGFFFEV